MTTFLPIVFIPGLFCNEALFQAQIQALQPAKAIVADITVYDSLEASAEDLLSDNLKSQAFISKLTILFLAIACINTLKFGVLL